MKKAMSILLLIPLLLFGCGKAEGVKLTVADDSAVRQWEKSMIDTSGMDSVHMACMAQNILYVASYPMHGADDAEKDFRFHVYQADTAEGIIWKELSRQFSKDENIISMQGYGENVILYLSDKSKGQQIYSILVLNKEGKELSRRDITDSGEKLTEGAFLGRMYPDSNGNIYFCLPTEVLKLGTDGKLVSLDSCRDMLTELETLDDNSVWLLQRRGEESVFQNAAGNKSYQIPLGDIQTVSGLLPEPRFFSEDGIYRMTDSGGTMQLEQEVSFSDCGLEASCFEEVMYSANGEYYILQLNEMQNTAGQQLVRLRPADSAGKSPVKTIRMGSLFFSDDAKKAVSIYNQSQDECRIELVEYGDDTAGQMQFSVDVISENCPDLFCMGNGEEDILREKDVLENLSKWLEGDKALSQDDLLDNVKRAYSNENGEMYEIAPGFAIHTVVTKQDRLDNPDRFTLSDAIRLEGEFPDKPLFGNVTETEILANLYQANREILISQDEKSCSFQSEPFRKMLQLSKDCADEEKRESPRPVQFKNDEILMTGIDIFEPNDFMLYTRMFEEPLAFTGYPVAQENTGSGTILMPMGGSFAMSNSSKNKEEAWGFFQTILGSEYQRSQCYPQYLPVRKDSMDYMLMLVSQTEEKTLEDGTKVRRYESEVGYDDYSVIITAMTEKEKQQFYKLLEAADHLYVRDRKVTDIISEEAQAYFGGAQTAHNVQEHIQSRIMTMLNE